MKKLIFMLIIFGTSFSSCNKKEKDFVAFSAPDSFDLVASANGIHNYQTNILTGFFGVRTEYEFEVTNDDGQTWIQKEFPSQYSPNGSYLISKDTFYVYSDRLCYTVDGGDSFEVLDSSSITHDLTFLSKTVGVKTGQHIYRTMDGGDNWAMTYEAPGFSGAKRIEFPSSTVGYSNVCYSSYGVIIKTTDGGVTWQEILPNIGEEIADISFVTTKKGYYTTILGDLFKTSDGGTTWTKMSDFSSTGAYNNQIEFVTESQGYAWNSSDAKVYLTKDSGLTWIEVAEMTNDNVANVERVGNKVYITGQYGTILKSN